MKSFIAAAVYIRPVLNAASSLGFNSSTDSPTLPYCHLDVKIAPTASYPPSSRVLFHVLTLSKGEKKELIFQLCTSISQHGLSPKESWQSKRAQDIKAAA